jgi:hypothetical protein
MHNPSSNQLPSVVIIDPAQCPTKEDFSMEKFHNGEYKAYFIGGSHKITAKQELSKKDGFKNFASIQNELCYSYVIPGKEKREVTRNAILVGDCDMPELVSDSDSEE